MNQQIQPPSPGSPLKAAWASQVTAAVNSIAAGGFAGTLARDGAGASGNAPLPANQRDRRGTSAAPAERALHPFDVRKIDGVWKVYLPEFAVIIGGMPPHFYATNDVPEPVNYWSTITKSGEYWGAIYKRDDVEYNEYRMAFALNGNLPTIEGFSFFASFQLFNFDIDKGVTTQFSHSVHSHLPENAGGGGGTEGVTGYYDLVSRVRWNTTSHNIEIYTRQLSFENGLLKSIGDETMTYISTTPHRILTDY